MLSNNKDNTIVKKLRDLYKQQETIVKAMKDPCLCEGTADVYSRVSGYYRCVGLWNKGKAQEFKERKVYDTGNF